MRGGAEITPAAGLDRSHQRDAYNGKSHRGDVLTTMLPDDARSLEKSPIEGASFADPQTTGSRTTSPRACPPVERQGQ